MSVSEEIKHARERRGLTGVEVAEKIGLTVAGYYDVEAYDDEAAGVLDLQQLKALCRLLEVDLYELFELESPQGVYLDYDLDRREGIIRNRRETLGLTSEQVADRMDFHDYVIPKVEADGEYLESWSLDSVMELAAVLDLPPWVLIGR